MPNPYMGMWIADRDRMAAFIASDLWKKTLDPWEVSSSTPDNLHLL